MDTPTPAIPAGFRGTAARLNQADIDRSAAKLGIPARLVQAIAYVEGKNHGFLADGRPQLLFEAYRFHRLTGGKYDQSHPDISSPRWNPTLYGAGGPHQYDRLAEAMALDHDAALQAATWGMFQELGENYRSVGYDTIDAFVAAMCASEGVHIDVFVAHCLANHLEGDLQAQDFMAFAERYNGPGQPNLYASKLIMAYQAGKFPPVLPSPVPVPDPPPPTPTPTPDPEPPPPAPAQQITLRPGREAVFPVAGVDQDGSPIGLPADALVSDDPTIVTASIAVQPDGTYLATVVALAAGSTTLHGPGLSIAIVVEAAILTRIVADLSRAVYQLVPAMAAAVMGLIMIASPIDEEVFAAATLPPSAVEHQAVAFELPKIEDPGFCFSDPRQSARAIKGCLIWTSVLFHR